MKTAAELIAGWEAKNPGITFRSSRDGSSIAVWFENAWHPQAGKGIDGKWYLIESQILCDGKPAFDPAIYGEAPSVAILRAEGK